MRIKPFFPVFIVLVGVVTYAYYAPKEKPESGITATPKQYIELVEKNKAERRKESQENDPPPPSAESPAGTKR